MKIYTRTGDAGETGLVGGRRVQKDHARVHAYGEVDELNSCLGVCRLYADPDAIDADLERLQSLLFDLGAELATPRESPYYSPVLSASEVEWLERGIDRMQQNLEPLRNFIVPGGVALGAFLHLARTVCRRAERSVLAFSRVEPVRPEVLEFLNRLSDWLFVAARFANQQAGQHDVIWKRGN